MQGDGKLGPGLLLNDPNHRVRDVRPAHFDDVAYALSGVEQQRKCEPFPRSKRPSVLELRQLIIRPSVARPRSIAFQPGDRVIKPQFGIDCILHQ